MNGGRPAPVVLSDEQFQRLAQYGRDEHVEAGRVLYATGDTSYDFFLLRTATVRAVREATPIESADAGRRAAGRHADRLARRDRGHRRTLPAPRPAAVG